MITNAHTLKMGSVLFVRSNGLISRMIRRVLDFSYSHVAVYIGMGKIIESDVGGVQINPVTRYIDNDSFDVEVVNPTLTHDQTTQMVTFMLAQFNDKYDYSLLFGNFLARVCHFLRIKLSVFNDGDAWICSELVAAGLREAGVRFHNISRITPKELYKILTGGSSHDTKR